MQLRDESIAYQYQGLLVPAGQDWTPTAELRARHYLEPARLRALIPQLMQVRSQVAAERELHPVPPELHPLDRGFIDLPQKLLEDQRRKGDDSTLGSIAGCAKRLQTQVDRVIILGVGGSCLGARALFEALCPAYHNELRPETRLNIPRIYFEGDHFDNDALHDLLELLQTTCVDPELREERWGAIVISKSGTSLEPAVAYRILRREAAEYYGSRSDRVRQWIVPVTAAESKLRELCKAQGYADSEILTIGEDISGRYSVFSPAGVLPAAVMGLDVRALLLGAAAMTSRFLEEPFERNPVLQYAGINYLMAVEQAKPVRILAVWSKKLEALGRWHDHLVAESLGKQGHGPTPLTIVHTRDAHSRGQHHQEGPRDKMTNNLIVTSPRTASITLGMAEGNEGGLNALSRKGLPDLLGTAQRATASASTEAVRPAADLVLPSLSEHTLGQLMQMLMLATVVEARLMGVNPYGQPASDAFKRALRAELTLPSR
jgi:glucose-6-phosphate isomerase